MKTVKRSSPVSAAIIPNLEILAVKTAMGPAGKRFQKRQQNKTSASFVVEFNIYSMHKPRQ